MDHLSKDGLAKVAATALELGTQDPEIIRLALCPKMSPEHWAKLMSGHG